MKKKLHKSIVFKLLMNIMIIILPINIIMIICAQMLVDFSKHQVMSEMKTTLNVYMDKLDSEIMSTEKFMTLIKHNEYFQGVLRQLPEEEGKYKNQREQVMLTYEMDKFLEEKELISGVAIEFDKLNLFIGRQNAGNIDNNIHSAVSLASEKEIEWQIVNIKNTDYILRSHKIADSNILVWIKVDKMYSYFKKLKSGNDMLSIIDTNKNSVLGGSIIQQDIDQVYVDSKLIPVRLIRSINEKNGLIYPSAVRILKILALLGVFAIPILIYQMKRHVLQPIDKILFAFERVRAGEIEYRISDGKETIEFQQIYHSFGDTMDQIGRLKMEIYEEQIEKQNIQLNYISHQIQPHFVLNTLNILYSYNQDEYPLMLDMIKLLMIYFRYIVKVNSYYVTVEQELAHINNYLQIQKIRYPDNFYYYIECETDIGRCHIPPLIMQNFVENCLKNAINVDNKIDIYVLVEKVNEQEMRIRIADTGAGFSAEVLEQIHIFNVTHTDQPELGVGLTNAILRLDILYKGRSKLSIYNSPSGGATVDIILPIWSAIIKVES